MTDVIIPLPDEGDGSRRARRQPPSRSRKKKREKKGSTKEPRAQRERRRPIVLLLLLLVALVAGGAAWYVIQEDDDEPGTATPSGSDAATRRPAGLVIQRGDDGSLVSVTLLVDRGTGGDLVYVPPGTMVEAPSLGLVPLREAGAGGSSDILVPTIENLLGTRLQLLADLGPDDLAAAVGPAEPIEVNVPAAVERRVGDRIETVFEPGSAVVAANQVADFLALPADGDLDRLVRHQAFWTGWLEAIAKGGVDTLPTAEPLRARIDRLAKGEAAHHVLPVETISGERDLFRVDKEQLDRLLGRVLPGTPTSEQRIRVQVLNGTGEPGVAQRVIGPLVDAGARMSLSGNADRFGYTTTQVVYYQDEHASDARKVRAALGVGEIVKSRSPLRVVAVTVVIGSDFTATNAGTTNTSQGAQP